MIETLVSEHNYGPLCAPLVARVSRVCSLSDELNYRDDQSLIYWAISLSNDCLPSNEEPLTYTDRKRHYKSIQNFKWMALDGKISEKWLFQELHID